MEPPLLDTSILLEKPRNGLVTGGRVRNFIDEHSIGDIEWCDIRSGPVYYVTDPGGVVTVSKCMGGYFEGAILISTCGLCGTCMDDNEPHS